jgi:hypothetical protein
MSMIAAVTVAKSASACSIFSAVSTAVEAEKKRVKSKQRRKSLPKFIGSSNDAARAGVAFITGTW